MYISPIWGTKTLGRIEPNLLVVGVHDVITPFEFGDDRFSGFSLAEGQSLPFPIDIEGRPYNTHTIGWGVIFGKMLKKLVSADNSSVNVILQVHLRSIKHNVSDCQMGDRVQSARHEKGEIWESNSEPKHAIANFSQTVSLMLPSGEYKQGMRSRYLADYFGASSV